MGNSLDNFCRNSLRTRVQGIYILRNFHFLCIRSNESVVLEIENDNYVMQLEQKYKILEKMEGTKIDRFFSSSWKGRISVEQFVRNGCFEIKKKNFEVSSLKLSC